MDPHDLLELEMFGISTGLEAVHLDVITVIHRDPPAPDLECTVKGEGAVAFELVELADRNARWQVSAALEIPRHLARPVEALRPRQRQEFVDRYRFANIGLKFAHGIHRPRRVAAVDSAVAFLLGRQEPMGADSTVYRRGVDGLTDGLEHIFLTRLAEGVGPTYHQTWVGSRSDGDALGLLRRKLEDKR